ncbi:protein SEEDLING PLASTID DEVELOPMENT 1 isoform X1 [Magnolia sinica]|uniref:protein SEEDLING PLASTID DEVELOPMENT 1 isoform X1 n=1 Tax=Magnolia sinica TaxID=86752 RepID=UPI00265A429C|nr:protein SEEDLING PLASTID DEVELOPMENT 1 isoform X1 [Magnolia sinica]
MRMLALPREGLIAPMLQLPLPPPTPTKQTFRTSQQKSASLRSQPFSVCYKCKFISSPISSFPKSPTKRLNSCSNSSAPTTDDDFDVELGRLLALLPDEMRRKVSEHPDRHHLIEIVMDLGRTPLARFPSGDFVLSDQPITFADLEHATSQVGDFATDNRAGISRTLHRISAIRNRKGVIIGLTCRVGRAISGSANLLRDLVKDGDSLLLIGPPGVGKTTIIREIARMLADDHSKRVMIVDTSNEIGGDGDIPHEGIGAARRMQVPNSDMQHKVLIEAVENHMPQVIVIDEISTKLEAVAASTIAQRGIQLVSTAHGVTIENLIMNPSLEMLVGGIQSVTLGDEEASRRGVQKTVLERRGPSTFTCGVEIISKTELRVHRSLEATVDALLSGRSPNFEVCKINSQGFAHEMVAVPIEPFSDISSHEQDEIVDGDLLEINDERISYNEFTSEFAAKMEEIPSRDEVQLHLYVYGILEASVVQAIKGLRMDDVVELTDNISKADAFLALFSKLKKNPRIQAVAKSHDIPIYVTKTSSLLQITKAIRAFVSKHADGFKDLEAEDKMSSSEKIDALEEARLAIEQIVIPKGEPVELLPRSPAIRSLQMDLAKKYQLQSEKVGEEPDARVCILPLHAARTEGNEFDDGLVDSVGNFNNSSSPSDINGSCNSMTKLPFLPD